MPSDTMNLCRLCGDEKSPLDFNVELSDKTASNWTYRELIEFHSRVSLKINKLLPQSVCEDCRAQVEGFSDFSQKLQEVQNSLDLEDEQENSNAKKTRSSRRHNTEAVVESLEIAATIPLPFPHDLQEAELLEKGEIPETSQQSLLKWSELIKPCDLCDCIASNILELTSHNLEVHVENELELSCTQCEENFKDNLDFINHSQRIHAEHLKHCCLICEKLFSDLGWLQQHYRHGHTNEAASIFQCIECGDYLASENGLLSHQPCRLQQQVRISKERKPDTEETFKAKRTRKEMSENDSDESSSSEDQKESKAVRTPRKKRPNETSPFSEINTYEMLYADEFSGTSKFPATLHLNTSRTFQLHDGEIPEEKALKVSGLRWKDFLGCAICETSFDNINVLLDHADSKHNSRAKLFHCRECDGEFTANCESPLINHLVERHHYEHLKFCCLVCSKMFYDLQSLITHNKTHSGKFELMVCLICGWFAKSLDDLKEHKTIHLSLEKSENQLLCDKIFEKISSGSETTPCNHCVADVDKNSDGTVTEECESRFEINWSFGQYQCETCALTFTAPFELFVHQRLKHPKELQKKNYFCKLCTDKKEYSNLFTFVNHATSKHLDNAKFTCIVCSKVFWNYLALAQHYKNVHPSFPCIFCCHCGKIFMNVTVASSHFKTLNLMLTPEERKLIKEGKIQEEMKHICHVCARSFKSRGTLLNHVKTHEVLEPSDLLQCHICSKLYKNKYKLAQHMVCHEDLRSWKCKACGQAFNYKKLLQRHIQAVHENERHFGCTFCEKRFNSKYDLTVHVRLHTGDFPYSCPVKDCDAKYPAWSNLFKHCQSRHKLDIRSDGYKKLKATQKSEEC